MPRSFPAIITFTGNGPQIPEFPGFPERPQPPPEEESPIDPGFGNELPPVIEGTPEHPICGPGGRPRPPSYPVDPGYGLPVGPGHWPMPPRPVDPSYGVPLPIGPDLPIYLPPGGDEELPIPPGAVWPPLPPAITGQILCFVWIVGVGYRWACIDAGLEPAHPIIPPSTVPEPEEPDTPERAPKK